MKSIASAYQIFADTVCRVLVSVMDVRYHRRAKRLSAAEKAHIASLIRPGDILVDSNDSFPGWQLASRVLLGSNWVHMGFCIGDGMVIDAGTESAVSAVTLNRFLRTSRVAILRPQYADATDAQAAVDHVRTFVGKTYNFTLNFEPGDTIYCTQMIRDVLGALRRPILIPLNNVLGRQIVSPQAFVDHAEITLVWDLIDSRGFMLGAPTCFAIRRRISPESA
jgi:hypothetical protein